MLKGVYGESTMHLLAIGNYLHKIQECVKIYSNAFLF